MSSIVISDNDKLPGSVLKKYYESPSILECGVDDAGRGPLFGRVYTAAVVLDPEIEPHIYLFDSKKVTSKRRKLVRSWIEENAIAYAVSWRDEKRIDSINISRATIESMHESIRNIGLVPDLILVDGDYFKPYLHNCDTFLNHKTIVNGDGLYASIAAASILAKEYHDQYIDELCIEHPYLDDKYALRQNKGYGTEYHRWALAKYGPTQYHRLSFLKNIKFE